jgi:hypothetical protein
MTRRLVPVRQRLISRARVSGDDSGYAVASRRRRASRRPSNVGRPKQRGRLVGTGTVRDHLRLDLHQSMVGQAPALARRLAPAAKAPLA